MIKTSIVDPSLALKIVRTSPVIAFDTETSGLNPNTDFICGYVITDWDYSVYVPVRHESGGNIPNAEDFEKSLDAAFAERGRLGYRTIGHNLGFDMRFCSRHDVNPRAPLEDTMINEALIDDRTKGYGLDDCSARHQVTVKRGADLYAAIASRFGGMPDKKQMGNFWRMPGDDADVLDYATGDGVSTIELWQSQQKILDDEELRTVHKLECDLIPYLARLNKRGIAVDMQYAEEIDGVIQERLAEANSVFAPGFSSRSPKEVEALYRLNGYTDDDFDRTATGKPSFTEKFLDKNEIGQSILKVRRLEKMRDSFVTPLVDTNNYDGRVHPTLNQSKSDESGAAGARLSCTAPNLQAFPKRNFDVGSVARKLIVADGDWYLEEGDAMQQEPRLFTHYSQDEALLAGYQDPSFSIHQRANDMMFGGKDYDQAKRMAMGILSMMFPKTLAVHLDTSISEAKKMRDRFLYDAFPAIGNFQNTAIKYYEGRGWVKSILGRKARLDDPRFAYRAVSRIIQNGGGDHNKTCLLRACQYEDANPGSIEILLAIHDSVLWQRDPGHDIKELVAVLENVPHEPEFNLSVPIPFEVGSAYNWADASYREKMNGKELKGKKGWMI